MAGEPWHTPCCGRCTLTHEVDVPDSARVPVVTTPLRQHFKELLTLARETIKILDDHISLYKSHFNNESIINMLENHPGHTGMPVLPAVTNEYLTSISPEITQELYHRLALIAAFTERAIMDETSAGFLEALQNFDHAIYSLLCKIKVIMTQQGIRVRSRVRRSIIGSTLIGLSSVAKLRARDYMVLRDARKMLVQVILPELTALISRIN